MTTLAEKLDDLRVVPRILVAMYGMVFYQVADWFMSLNAPNGAQAAFVSTVVGAGAAWFGFYVNSGPRR